MREFIFTELGHNLTHDLDGLIDDEPMLDHGRLAAVQERAVAENDSAVGVVVALAQIPRIGKSFGRNAEG